MTASKIKENTIGKKVAEARKEKGMMQVDLSAALEIDFNIIINQKGISKIENGIRAVRDVEIRALCKIFNKDANYFFDM